MYSLPNQNFIIEDVVYAQFTTIENKISTKILGTNIISILHYILE